MKRILLGGTALAAAMAAMPASAQDRNVTSGLELSISGFLSFEAALLISDDDEDVDRDYDFNSDARLQWDFKNVTDSGLEYGARIRMDDVNRREDVGVDRQYLYVSGSFGRFDFGDTPTTAGDFGYFFAPDDILLAGHGYGNNIDGNFRYGGANFFSLDPTYRTGFDKSTGIKYASPSFGGFIFGLTFQPVVSVETRDLSNGTQGRADLFDEGQLYENLISLGLGYESEFDGTSIKIRGTATYANGVDGDGDLFEDDFGIGNHFDLETYSLGGQFTSGPITGSLVWVYTPSGFTGTNVLQTGVDDDTGAPTFEGVGNTNINDPVQTLAAGLGYTFGPFNFGLGYAYTWADGNTLVGSDSEGFDMEDNHVAAVTVSYALAPGLHTYGEVVYQIENFRRRFDGDDIINGGATWEQAVFQTGITVSF